MTGSSKDKTKVTGLDVRWTGQISHRIAVNTAAQLWCHDILNWAGEVTFLLKMLFDSGFPLCPSCSPFPQSVCLSCGHFRRRWVISAQLIIWQRSTGATVEHLTWEQEKLSHSPCHKDEVSLLPPFILGQSRWHCSPLLAQAAFSLPLLTHWSLLVSSVLNSL